MIKCLLFLEINSIAKLPLTYITEHTVPQWGKNQNMCFPVMSCIRVWCHIAVVSEGNKNTAHSFSPVSSRWQSRCYGLSQLWEQVADPFPWSLSCLALCVQPSWGEIESVCSLLLPHVFAVVYISIPLFSSSQVMFQVGWQSTARSYRRARKFVSSVQKHVLTVCATSGGKFTPRAILFCSHITQYSWQVLFAHPAKAKHILRKRNNNKKGHM